MQMSSKTEKKQNRQAKKDARQGSFQKKREYLLTENSDFFITEAYKTLRTNLIFSLASHEGSKALIVTSAMQSEGKSTSASNIAISYAQDTKKVLLIDCDLRRPKLNRLFGVSSKIGLTDVLVDANNIHDAILHTDVANLDLLLCGTIPPNPSELLSSDKMAELIAKMRKEYDLIVLDTPPIAMVSDAVVLVPLTDAVVVVARAGYSEANAIAFALDQLSRAKAKVLGFILNAADFKKTSYGFVNRRYSKYGYYGRGYGYQSPVYKENSSRE